jgi:hypothetical protein
LFEFEFMCDGATMPAGVVRVVELVRCDVTRYD